MNYSGFILPDTTRIAFDSLATRQRRKSAHAHQTPDADELAAIRPQQEIGNRTSLRFCRAGLGPPCKAMLANIPSGSKLGSTSSFH